MSPEFKKIISLVNARKIDTAICEIEKLLETDGGIDPNMWLIYYSATSITRDPPTALDCLNRGIEMHPNSNHLKMTRIAHGLQWTREVDEIRAQMNDLDKASFRLHEQKFYAWLLGELRDHFPEENWD